MKSLKDTILERLKLNRYTKIGKNISIEFDKDISFSEKEIDIVKKYAQQFKITPVALSNYRKFEDSFDSFITNIFIYFYDDWNTKIQDTYLYLTQDVFHGGSWYCLIVINDEDSYLHDSTTNHKYVSKNIENVCKELTKYLDENPDFYNKIRKSKK